MRRECYIRVPQGVAGAAAVDAGGAVREKGRMLPLLIAAWIKLLPECCPQRTADPRSWDCEAVAVGGCCRYLPDGSGPAVKRIDRSSYDRLRAAGGSVYEVGGSSSVRGDGAWFYELIGDQNTCHDELRS